MVSMVCMMIGTIAVILFLIMMIKGQKFSGLVLNLDEDKFQLKELYTVGFAWESLIPVLGPKGALAKNIRGNVVLLYGEKYAEFYIRVILAKAYTYAHLIFCLFSVLTGMVNVSSAPMMLLAGTIVGGIMVYMVINDVKSNVSERTDAYLLEFPNVVTKLALMLETGMILRDAWIYVTKTTNGQLKIAMEKTCEQMKNGESDVDAIYQFGQYSGTKEIKKFASTVIQGMNKGNADLAMLLRQQSAELWELKRQRMLQKGEEAATKLVIPTTLMFVGIIIVIVGNAMGGMSL